MSPGSTIRTSTILAAFLAALTVTPALTRPAAADTVAPVTLAGNPDIQNDRIQMLREEFKERQKEIRESLERAKRLKHGRGVKVEPVPGDADYAGPRGHLAIPGGLSALSAPSNTKANDKTLDAAGAGQAEQSIAMVGQNGLCAWNDGQGFNLTPQDVQGYGYTTNGGATWTDGGIPPKAGTIATWTSDPVVTVNEKSGEYYYCGLTSNTGTNNNGVGVARGHFAGGTFVWDGESMVASGPSSSQAFDKQWMCADSLTGNLYVSWTLFVVGGDNIFFSRSTDGGVTWSAPLQINGSWENGRVSGSRPMVGPNGEVYVQYTAIGPVDADSVKIAKSTSFGTGFNPAVVAMTPYDNFFTGAPGFNRPRAVTFAAGAVDRSTGTNRGRVYMTIQDCVNFYGDGLGGLIVNEVENNGGFANATPFTIGQVLRGSITSTTDQDWWSFPAVQGTTYIFFVDSLRTTSFRYTMRLYCPNDTTVLSRLAFSGAQATNSALNSHSLIVWTAPTTNTYYLRMVPVTVGTGNNQYRILTGFHTSSSTDVARDTRDVVVTSSSDGQTGWAARKVINDDAPLYDNWLPEVVVPCDGNAYAMWFDWRDTPASCFGGSNIYVSRSLDGGSTWAPNVVATTAATANWTQVLSNIAPNQGDYNGMYGGDQIAFAFADGRLGDSDVFTARDGVDFSSPCRNDTTVLAGGPLALSYVINNQSVLFPNTAAYTLTVNRNWPGLPASGTLALGNGASGNVNLSFPVPDSAASGPVRLCFTVAGTNGACAQSCCVTLNVINLATPALASLVDATAGPGRVNVTWSVSVATPVHVYRSLDGSAWTLMATLTPDGDGRVAYTDASVSLGTRYAYRLGIASGGVEAAAGETWVTVPAQAEFALHGGRPNPSTGPLSISFSLADGSSARLELVDLNGRRVLDREVGSMGAGFHVLPLDGGARLPVGFYVVRLTQHGRTLNARVTIVR